MDWTAGSLPDATATRCCIMWSPRNAEGRGGRLNTSVQGLDVAGGGRVRSQQGPVCAGLIGCGDFGTSIVAQAASAPLLEIPAAADLDLDSARRAYRRAGLPDEAVV